MEEKLGIIFDMDGTLWDSAQGVAQSWNEIIEKEYSPDKKLTAKDIQSVMGLTMDRLAQKLFPDLEERKRMELLDHCGNHENEYLRIHGGVLYDGLEETLMKLHENYHLYIVSNCQSGYIEAFLEHYHFEKYFDDIECYGNNLMEKGDNIRNIVERNHLTKAVYVGDIQGDYEASRIAGISFIHAAYGFGTIEAEVPKINSFRELPDVISF
ncbi:MAG: HAD family hydrolase [Lachnospiraceae bacterium]